MRKFFIFVVIVFTSCTSSPLFNPGITGSIISHDWMLDTIHLRIDSQGISFKLPVNDSTDYSYPSWLNNENAFLMSQYKKEGDSCYSYQVVKFDAKGNLSDTVFTPDPCNIIHAMPSPNDSLLLVRSYSYRNWKLGGSSVVTYSVIDMYTKAIVYQVKHRTALDFDHLASPVWSPDSRRFIVADVHARDTQLAYIHGVNGETTLFGAGKNFTWSPADTNIVAYLKDNTIFFKNVLSSTTTEFYKGKKTIVDFLWHPNGDYLLVNVGDYSLKIKKGKFWHANHILVATADKQVSEEFLGQIVFESWK